MTGFVSIVGAGPWDPELLTLAAQDRVSHAEVVIVDYLVNPAVLMHCRSDALILQRAAGPHGVKALDQDEVNAKMVEFARAGAYVVRLKGGDPMVFGRGAEEAEYLRAHGIEFEFVPGVSSPIAGPQYAGIPITHRDYTPAVTFVSGFEAYEKNGLHVAWEHLAKGAGTIVLMMSVRNCRANAEHLVRAGRSADTPAAVVRWGTRGIQHTVVGTLADIADRIDAAKIRPPALLVVGEVVAQREKIQWFEALPLYNKRIVVTRASADAKSLIHGLSANGADAVAFPCLSIAPPDSFDELDAALRNIRTHFGIIVTSPRGVESIVERLLVLNQDARSLAGLKVVAIGTGTAAACKARGILPDLLPLRATSEGLVDALMLRGWLGCSWLHVRGDEGRSVLAQAILENGGTITTIVGYRVVRPKIHAPVVNSLRDPQFGGEGCDAIVFASGKTARHFIETLREQLGDEEAARVVAHAKIIAAGPITAQALVDMGLQVDAVADEPSDEATLDSVLRCIGTGARTRRPLHLT